ncbi:hypothetical protein ICN35_08775 [Polynucleobacter sp. es-GGE-1]|uniref:hypothetical protein n=1 Tax=Polynucleobacter sp. es-GGE-1 TaxID=1819724 RepID=UPI001C0D9DDC|nr:hypothetical protein [Polynucleobacter sp. es-GGE-1]MBU3635552.1 hypothetical protein [Polynucleobacter sp. es-GGE-1]
MIQYTLPTIKALLGYLNFLNYEVNYAAIQQEFYSYKWYSKSRFALKEVVEIKYRKINRRVNLFIPLYYCKSAIEVIDKSKVNFIYYDSKINPNCKHEFDQVLLSNADIILVTHYFGEFNKNIEYLHNYSRGSGAWLIEDCVHLIDHTKIDQCFGDFIIFSPYKHIALLSGSLLYYKKDLYIDETFLPDSASINVSLINLLKWVAKKFIQKILFSINAFKVDDFLISSNKDKYFPINIDNISLAILSNIDINYYKAIRIQNFNKLSAIIPVNLLNCKILPIVNDAPYFLVLEFSNSSERNFALNLFKSVKFPVIDWPDLPEFNNKDGETNYAYLKKGRLIFVNISNYYSKYKLLTLELNLIKKLSLCLNFRELDGFEWYKTNITIVNGEYTNSYDYSRCKRSLDNSINTLYLEISLNDNIIGKTALNIKNYFNIINIAYVNRGPTLYYDCNQTEIISIIKKLSRIYSHLVLIINPSFKISNVYMYLASNLGIYYGKKYSSSVLKLDMSNSELEKNLHPKWRNTLKKGIKSSLNIDLSSDLNLPVENIIKFYELHQKVTGYKGLDSKFLASLLESNLDLLPRIFVGYSSSEQHLTIHGLVVTLKYANKTTYVIGSTDLLGRQNHLNSALLWTAILKAKSDEAYFFDLGGVDSTTPYGIRKFKEGLNGDPYEYSKKMLMINL